MARFRVRAWFRVSIWASFRVKVRVRIWARFRIRLRISPGLRVQGEKHRETTRQRDGKT